MSDLRSIERLETGASFLDGVPDEAGRSLAKKLAAFFPVRIISVGSRDTRSDERGALFEIDVRLTDHRTIIEPGTSAEEVRSMFQVLCNYVALTASDSPPKWFASRFLNDVRYGPEHLETWMSAYLPQLRIEAEFILSRPAALRQQTIINALTEIGFSEKSQFLRESGNIAPLKKPPKRPEVGVKNEFDIGAAIAALVDQGRPDWSSARKALAKQNVLEGLAAAEVDLQVSRRGTVFALQGATSHTSDEALAEFAPSLTVKDREEIWAEATKIDRLPIPELTPEDVAAIKRKAKSHPWSSRPSHKYSPFEWIREHYKQWLPGLLQHHLKFDNTGLYDAFAQRVKREGLPDWLDVPAEKDAALRNISDPLERAKMLAVRRLSRLQARGVRALRQLKP